MLLDLFALCCLISSFVIISLCQDDRDIDDFTEPCFPYSMCRQKERKEEFEKIFECSNGIVEEKWDDCQMEATGSKDMDEAMAVFCAKDPEMAFDSFNRLLHCYRKAGVSKSMYLLYLRLGGCTQCYQMKPEFYDQSQLARKQNPRDQNQRNGDEQIKIL